MGVFGQDDWVQKPGKEFDPKTAFLDGLPLVLALSDNQQVFRYLFNFNQYVLYFFLQA
jgi:hypothetical protein